MWTCGRRGGRVEAAPFLPTCHVPRAVGGGGYGKRRAVAQLGRIYPAVLCNGVVAAWGRLMPLLHTLQEACRCRARPRQRSFCSFGDVEHPFQSARAGLTEPPAGSEAGAVVVGSRFVAARLGVLIPRGQAGTERLAVPWSWPKCRTAAGGCLRCPVQGRCLACGWAIAKCVVHLSSIFVVCQLQQKKARGGHGVLAVWYF